MLFAGEDGVKKVRVLSGGEKVRVMLSKLMISGANVLIIDEPTDHLDMESITALNNGLIKFSGVVLFSSHDHQFVQTTANRILKMTKWQESVLYIQWTVRILITNLVLLRYIVKYHFHYNSYYFYDVIEWRILWDLQL